MLVTRVIGTKIRRRPNTSATMPSTRGWLASERMATTRSRTLPTWSPCGSKIGRPTRRAAYTRDGAVLTRLLPGPRGGVSRRRAAPPSSGFAGWSRGHATGGTTGIEGGDEGTEPGAEPSRTGLGSRVRGTLSKPKFVMRGPSRAAASRYLGGPVPKHAMPRSRRLGQLKVASTAVLVVAFMV